MFDAHEHGAIKITVKVPCQRLQLGTGFRRLPELCRIPYSALVLDGMIEFDLQRMILGCQKALHTSEDGLALV
jgi:hypothetical protein